MNQNTSFALDLKFRIRGSLPEFSLLKALKWLLPFVPLAIRLLARLHAAGP